MVARLKLKGIDGRAPPGVKGAQAQSAPKSWLLQASICTAHCACAVACDAGKQLPASRLHTHNTYHGVQVGDTIKLREVPKALSTKRSSKDERGRGNDLGYGKNDKDAGVPSRAPQWVIRSQVLQHAQRGVVRPWMQFTD